MKIRFYFGGLLISHFTNSTTNIVNMTLLMNHNIPTLRKYCLMNSTENVEMNSIMNNIPKNRKKYLKFEYCILFIV